MDFAWRFLESKEVSVMEWYALRTVCGKEDKALLILRRIFYGFELIYPKRRISWRKQGGYVNLVKPLFDGYIFISCLKEKIRDFDKSHILAYA